MKPFNKNIINTQAIFLMGFGFGLFFWLVDTLVDYFFFNEENSELLDVLVDPEPMDLWMRLLVVVLLLVFAYWVQKLLQTEKNVRYELEVYKGSLEQKVQERTLELQRGNEELKNEITNRKKIEEELKRLASTDTLTGLYNRRMFLQLLQAEIVREKRYGVGLCLIYCDLDHFKLINDFHGHDVGDKVLQVFSNKIKLLLRDSDLFARWGGEEFIAAIPQANSEQAFVVANKIRACTEAIDLAPLGRFTVSLGVTAYHEDDTVESFIKRADDALYTAKQGGRNRVEVLLKNEDS